MASICPRVSVSEIALDSLPLQLNDPWVTANSSSLLLSQARTVGADYRRVSVYPVKTLIGSRLMRIDDSVASEISVEAVTSVAIENRNAAPLRASVHVQIRTSESLDILHRSADVIVTLPAQRETLLPGLSVPLAGAVAQPLDENESAVHYMVCELFLAADTDSASSPTDSTKQRSWPLRVAWSLSQQPTAAQ